jgi:hypothetical protein
VLGFDLDLDAFDLVDEDDLVGLGGRRREVTWLVERDVDQVATRVDVDVDDERGAEQWERHGRRGGHDRLDGSGLGWRVGHGRRILGRRLGAEGEDADGRQCNSTDRHAAGCHPGSMDHCFTPMTPEGLASHQAGRLIGGCHRGHRHETAIIALRGRST